MYIQCYTYIIRKLQTKVRQVTKICVRFSKERGKGPFPTMLHALLHKTRRDSLHKNKASVGKCHLPCFCVDCLGALYAILHATKCLMSESCKLCHLPYFCVETSNYTKK